MPFLHILSTVNSGLLIWTDRTKLFVDGIHGSGFGFSPVPPSVCVGLAQGLPPFDHIDYLLFTHGHPDHFSLPDTAQFLAEHPIKALVLPYSSGQPATTQAVLDLLPDPPICLFPSVPPWESCSYELGDFKVTYLHTPHIPAPLQPECHCSILLEYENTRLLIAGDMDFPANEQVQWLVEQQIDYGIFNPFFIFHRSGRQTLCALNLKMTYIYHIPYPDPENRELLDQVGKSMAAHAKRLPPTKVLTPGSSVLLLLERK